VEFNLTAIFRLREANPKGIQDNQRTSFTPAKTILTHGGAVPRKKMIENSLLQ
jgi:hypothetical protein